MVKPASEISDKKSSSKILKIVRLATYFWSWTTHSHCKRIIKKIVKLTFTTVNCATRIQSYQKKNKNRRSFYCLTYTQTKITRELFPSRAITGYAYWNFILPYHLIIASVPANPRPNFPEPLWCKVSHMRIVLPSTPTLYPLLHKLAVAKRL